MTEFIPTLGNMIKEYDAILRDTTFRDIPKSLYPDYAKLFKGTIIEEVLFTGENFEEAACIYCEEAGWRRPQ